MEYNSVAPSPEPVEDYTVRNSKTVAWTLLGGVFILALAVLLYHHDTTFTLARSSKEWAEFGSFLGGVAGPFLSFLALVLIARAVHLQVEDIAESRRANSEQGRFLGEQLAILRSEHRLERLENMADTTKKAIESYLLASVTGFDNRQLETLLHEVAAIAGIHKLANKHITLLEGLEMVRRGQDALSAVPQPEDISVYSKVAAVDRLPRLAWSVQDYFRLIHQIGKTDVINDERDIDQYVYKRTEGYRGLVTRLYLLGVVDDVELRKMKLDGALAVQDGIDVRPEASP